MGLYDSPMYRTGMFEWMAVCLIVLLHLRIPLGI